MSVYGGEIVPDGEAGELGNGVNARAVMAAAGAVLVVLSLSGIGLLMMGGARGTPAASWAPAPALGVDDPTTAPGTVAPTTPAATATPKVTKRPTPRPTPSRKPPRASLPPPPAPTTSATVGPNCPSYIGPNAERSDVKAALPAAAARRYWDGVPQDDYPPGLTGPMPEITVPINLMKAVAWQESGWQSAIKACDGGLGVMQITPSPPGLIGTDKQMNNRFHTNYDVTTLTGNAALGAEYLEWLTMYFGLYYFGNFDLSLDAPKQPLGTGGAQLRLLDVVIAAYNVGPGSVESPDQVTLRIPNPTYVGNVRALMTECVCLGF
jgi:soluble lytic murein transglycosylase-like protein